MATVRVKMLRPLLGDDDKGNSKRFERNQTRTMDKADAERLAATGAVEIVGAPKRTTPAAKPKAKQAKKPANKQAPAPSNKAG